MKQYLIVNSSDNKVMYLEELDVDFMKYIDEIVLECEIIDLQSMKYYRPCGWLDITEG